MKLRCAGALSLVGWYLMLPPLQFVGQENDPYSVAIVDDAAPLSRWLPMMTFETLQECLNISTRLARNMRSVKTERDKRDVETLIGIWLGKYSVSQPRLRASRKNSAPHIQLNGFCSLRQAWLSCVWRIADFRYKIRIRHTHRWGSSPSAEGSPAWT